MAAGRPGWGCQPAVSRPILGPSITHYEAGACPLAGTGSRRAGHSPLFRGLDWQAALPIFCLPPSHGVPTWDLSLPVSATHLQEPRRPRCPHSPAGGEHHRLVTCAPAQLPYGNPTPSSFCFGVTACLQGQALGPMSSGSLGKPAIPEPCILI